MQIKHYKLYFFFLERINKHSGQGVLQIGYILIWGIWQSQNMVWGKMQEGELNDSSIM